MSKSHKVIIFIALILAATKACTTDSNFGVTGKCWNVKCYYDFECQSYSCDHGYCEYDSAADLPGWAIALITVGSLLAFCAVCCVLSCICGPICCLFKCIFDIFKCLCCCCFRKKSKVVYRNEQNSNHHSHRSNSIHIKTNHPTAVVVNMNTSGS